MTERDADAQHLHSRRRGAVEVGSHECVDWRNAQSVRLCDDAFPNGDRYCFELGVRTELDQDPLHVVADSGDADKELIRDLRRRGPGREQFEDFALTQ